MKAVSIDSLNCQAFDVILANGNRVNFNIYFSDLLSSWRVDIKYGDKIFSGVRLCSNNNILSKYKNIIPFGVAILGENDPFFLDSFSSGQNEFCILDKDEGDDLNV
jgi:hypothetical protein